MSPGRQRDRTYDVYAGVHILLSILRVSAASPTWGAILSSIAFDATAPAIWKATSLNADTGGKILPLVCSVLREISAKVLAAAMNMPSVIRFAWQAIAPRPIPGKM